MTHLTFWQTSNSSRITSLTLAESTTTVQPDHPCISGISSWTVEVNYQRQRKLQETAEKEEAAVCSLVEDIDQIDWTINCSATLKKPTIRDAETCVACQNMSTATLHHWVLKLWNFLESRSEGMVLPPAYLTAPYASQAYYTVSTGWWAPRTTSFVHWWVVVVFSLLLSIYDQCLLMPITSQTKKWCHWIKTARRWKMHLIG